MLLSTAPMALAADPQTPIRKQRALEIARDALQITDDYKLNRSYYNLDEFGNQTWGFDFISRTDKGERNANVGVDAVTGKIRNFYRYAPDNYGPRKFSIEEARKIAEDFLVKNNPDLTGETRLEPLEPWIQQNSKESFEVPFRFSRIVNGYPYWDNGVTISVSTANGQVTSYWFNWDKDPVPVSETLITPGKAKETFNSIFGLELGYLRIYPKVMYNEKMYPQKTVTTAAVPIKEKIIAPPYEPPKPQVILAYYPKSMNYGAWIDAATGEIISPNGQKIRIPETVYNTPVGESVTVTPPAQPLDMEEAMARAKAVADIPADYKLSWVNYEENTDPRRQPVWNFNWNTRKPPYGNISVNINAVTGEITGLESYAGDPWTNPMVDLTEEQAKAIAVDYVKKMFPSRLGELRMPTVNLYEDPYLIKEGKRPFYDFNFSRLVNGIPFNENNIWVSVNGKGNVIRFHSNWEKLDFPAVEDVISLEKASGIMNIGNVLEPGYVRLMKTDGTFETRLVYRYQAVYYETAVNAKTGEIINRYNGGPIRIMSKFDDVKGHWAEKDIDLLAGKNIVGEVKENKFQPNDAITRADIVEMLVKARELNPYYAKDASFSDVPKNHKAYGYIEAAFKAGIIAGSNGKFAPDKPITREEMVIVLVKALGDKAVKGDQTGFKDDVKISAWARDGVAAAVASGILKGDAKGNFNPRSKVTRAEAAAMVARLMDQLAE
jgi:hypothetical protein